MSFVNYQPPKEGLNQIKTERREGVEFGLSQATRYFLSHIMQEAAESSEPMPECTGWAAAQGPTCTSRQSLTAEMLILPLQYPGQGSPRGDISPLRELPTLLLLFPTTSSVGKISPLVLLHWAKLYLMGICSLNLFFLLHEIPQVCSAALSNRTFCRDGNLCVVQYDNYLPHVAIEPLKCAGVTEELIFKFLFNYFK